MSIEKPCFQPEFNLTLRTLSCPESADVKGFMYALTPQELVRMTTCVDVRGAIDGLNEQVADCDARRKLLDCVKQEFK